MLIQEDILGYPVDYGDLETCIQQIVSGLEEPRKSRYLVCLNPHSYEVARRDQIFHQALCHADMIVPDGVGIVLASRLLGGSIRHRITGSDIFAGLNGRLNDLGGFSCFFLGSTEQTLVKIVDKMALTFPAVKVCGVYSPPFRQTFTESDNRAMLTAIHRANPDVLWVGMTAPKQEKWIYAHRDELQEVGFIGAVGAVFDFFAGTVQRSHPLFQRCGLEWLPRLIRQPSKLWRRNFVSNPCFMFRVMKEAVRLRLQFGNDA